MKTYFTKGKNNIYWIGSNFKSWFGGMPIKKSDGKLTSRTLERNMTDQEILNELKPQESTLGDIAKLMTENKELLTNGYANVFYVKDKDKVLRAVGVFWFAGRGWRVGAFPVGSPFGWLVGHRVFSRNWPLESSPKPFDPLTLEKRVKVLEDKMDKISKFLVIE